MRSESEYIDMDLDFDNLSDDFYTNLKYLGVTVLIAVIFIGLGNMMTPDDPKQVGLTELETECRGLDLGVCIGFQTEDHTTYNYDDYESWEEGTDNYYRLVESELMIQAYDICGENVSGMDWVSEAEYDGQSGDEWLENDNVELLACDQVTHHSIRG